MQRPFIVANQHQHVSPLEGHRADAVGGETKQGTSWTDWITLPVVGDSETDRPLPWSRPEEAPADHEVAPPKCDPQAENSAGVRQPLRVGRRPGELIDPSPGGAPIEFLAHRNCKQYAKATVHGHVEKSCGEAP